MQFCFKVKFSVAAVLQDISCLHSLVSTGTSKNGTAFGLQMSQAGFSAHNVEVSLTNAPPLSHAICHCKTIHIVSISAASDKWVIYHFHLMAPYVKVHTDSRGTHTQTDRLFPLQLSVMRNKMLCIPKGNILVKDYYWIETVLPQNDSLVLKFPRSFCLYLSISEWRAAGVLAFSAGQLEEEEERYVSSAVLLLHSDFQSSPSGPRLKS